MNVNVEELHGRWLDEMAEFAREFMKRQYAGAKPEQAAIVTLSHKNEYIFETLGIFDLPPGSGDIILLMARFCRCTLSPPEAVIGLPGFTEQLPEPVFCLNSLLMAAFPKNTATGVFKGHDCAICVGDLGDPEGAFRSGHVAFGGLGVILMNETRKILNPLAPDADVIKLADDHFLCIMR